MKRVCAFLFGFALGIGGLAAQAQTGATKPACAAGDTVVWENTSTKAYHLPGDKFYGGTKHGAYACRSAADTAGYHLAGAKGSRSAGETIPVTQVNTPAPMASGTPAQFHHGKHHHKSGSMASPAPSPAAT